MAFGNFYRPRRRTGIFLDRNNYRIYNNNWLNITSDAASKTIHDAENEN